MVAAGEAAKESVKQLIVPGMLFEELGIQYVGPIDGHDIAQVQNAITWAKGADGPCSCMRSRAKAWGTRTPRTTPTRSTA